MSRPSSSEPVEARWETLTPGRVLRLTLWRTLESGDRRLTWAEVLDLWQGDADFGEAFGRALADAPFEAFFWESPPLDRARLEHAFECVLVASPTLAGLRSDLEPFREHLDRPDPAPSIGAFWNLGGDAFLIAPRPEGPLQAYAHLAAFLRGAPASQRGALWRELGKCVARHVGDEPLWLSTSGLGVAWLHVRLDRFPKYYQHGPYRDSGFGSHTG